MSKNGQSRDVRPRAGGLIGLGRPPRGAVRTVRLPRRGPTRPVPSRRRPRTARTSLAPLGRTGAARPRRPPSGAVRLRTRHARRAPRGLAAAEPAAGRSSPPRPRRRRVGGATAGAAAPRRQASRLAGKGVDLRLGTPSCQRLLQGRKQATAQRRDQLAQIVRSSRLVHFNADDCIQAIAIARPGGRSAVIAAARMHGKR
jgi:hypothetical protein